MLQLLSCNAEAQRICSRPLDDIPQERVPKLHTSKLHVFLHIYDVTQESSVQWLNALFAHKLSPMKFGGVFHVGVEIDGVEWSYGYSERGTGVSCDFPKMDRCHHFRETIKMDVSDVTLSEFDQLIRELKQEYVGNEYHLFKRNCCHFADDLCHRLKVGEIPSWVYRLANVGELLSKYSQQLQDTAITRLSTCNGVPCVSKSCRADARSRCTPLSTSKSSPLIH